MPDAKKKPCCICHRWFRPNVRVGSRQRTCGRPECQQALRQKSMSAWRKRNPDYFIGWRIQARCKSEHVAKTKRLPHPLSNLPWDIAREEFGPKGADFIDAMGKVVLQSAKNQLKGHFVDSNRDGATLPLVPAKNQFKGQVIDSA